MKKWTWVIALSAAVILTGCIKMEQNITLNKDGSGSFQLMYAMSEESISQMKVISQMGASEGEEVESDSNFEFDEEKVRAQFEEMKDRGVTLKKVRSETRDGWKYMYVDCDFQDLSGLAGTSGGEEIPVTISKNAEGDYVITSQMGGDEMGMPETDPESLKMMLPMLAGMRIAFRVNTPTRIISTTAPIRTDNSAEWVFDVDADPESILKLGKEKMEIVFDGTGVNIPEIN